MVAEWLSLSDVAQILGIHPSTVRSWSDQGVLPVHRTKGGHRRYLRNEVDLWVLAQRSDPNSEANLVIQSAMRNTRFQISEGRLVADAWYAKLEERGAAQVPAAARRARDAHDAPATVQANLDYASEADMAAKMRTAMGVSPIVSALFANSSLYLGKPSGYVSRRVHIWRHVDPDRCGMLPFVFEPGLGYERYVEWALDVPMFFVLRDGRYLPSDGMSFRRFLAVGHELGPATLQDWNLHLTTLFPEVRLKQFLEVRGADAVPPGLICALPALWKGLLYDDDAREAAWGLVADWQFPERDAALEAVARRGLAAEVAGRPVLPLARELVAIDQRKVGPG